MLSLGKHRSYRNPKTKKNIKPFDASLSNFQDFLNKSLTKPDRSTSKMFNPNKTKIEKLNFSSTAMSTSFLPPKSVDKHRFSLTNQGFMTSQPDFLKLETPKNKEKSAFFVENQPEQIQLTQRQIKQKVEINAMKRFQQLFRKQNNVRTKKIESQQSKRLIGLLEKTSRVNRQNQPQQTFNKPNKPYFATSKKNIKIEQDEVLQEHRNQRFLNERIPVSQHKNEQKIILIQNPNELKKNFKFEIKRKNSLIKQRATIEQVKQIRQKQVVKQKQRCQGQQRQIFKGKSKADLNKNGRDQQKQVETFMNKQKQVVNRQKQIVNKQSQRRQNNEMIKNNEQIAVKNKIETTNDHVNQQISINASNVNQVQLQINTNKNVNKNTNVNVNIKQRQQTKQIKDNNKQKKQINKQKKQINKQKTQIKKQQTLNLNKEENGGQQRQKQKIKKNSFQAQAFQIEEVKTYQKVEYQRDIKKQRQYQLDNKYKVQAMTVDKDKDKDTTRGEQQQNIQIKQIKNNNNHLSKGNNNIMKSHKDSITIKTSRDMKVSLSEKKQQIAGRYSKQQQYEDDLDLDVVEIGNINNNNNNNNNNNKNNKGDVIIKKDNKFDNNNSNNNNKKDESIVPKAPPIVNNSKRQTTNNKETKVSLTSLAEQVQRIQGREKFATNKSVKLSSSSQIVKNKQKKQSKQQQQQHLQHLQQQQQQQQQQLHPADELDYLICLIQNLGRYYNKSKQFYSLTESSMVEIVMNHKLAAYYNSQQFYYYLNLFVNKIDNILINKIDSTTVNKINTQKEKQQSSSFYSLSFGQLVEALQDESIQQAIQDLKSSLQVAKKLIKHTYQKAKIYLKKQQKQLLINSDNNYHTKCVTYIKEQFTGLYKLYEERKSKTLAERLCYLIQMYCILKALNQQETKEFEDLEDIGEDNYHQHILQNKHILY